MNDDFKENYTARIPETLLLKVFSIVNKKIDRTWLQENVKDTIEQIYKGIDITIKYIGKQDENENLFEIKVINHHARRFASVYKSVLNNQGNEDDKVIEHNGLKYRSEAELSIAKVLEDKKVYFLLMPDVLLEINQIN